MKQGLVLEHTQDDVDNVCAALLNNLELLQPPGFIYAAQAPDTTSLLGQPGRGSAARRARLQDRAAAAGGVGSQDVATVYGTYAAVMLADATCAAACICMNHRVAFLLEMLSTAGCVSSFWGGRHVDAVF
jgi:hypothetical protein